MSNIALPHSDLAPTAPATSTVVTAVLILWFAAIVFLGATGALVTPANQPPLLMLLAALAPLTVFFAAFWMSRSFRALIAAADLHVVASIQAWRFGGFVFLILYAYGILPGLFALHAGLGDMAIGITAPWIVLSLNRSPAFAKSRAFRVWNWLGILDLVVAVNLGAASSLLATRLPGEITTAPMALLPLVLIPAYFVPILIMLHFAALHQSRRPQ
jgi:hypothetical protein